MSSIDASADDDAPTQTASAFFYDVVVPLKRAGARREESFFSTAPDAGLDSYWQEVSTRTGGVGQLTAEVDGAALVDALTAHWEQAGETRLVRIAGAVKALERELSGDRRESASEQVARAQAEELSDFVYPLF